LDPARVAFYGQIRCPIPTHREKFYRVHGSFFGGGGGLYSPTLLQRLKALGVQPEYREVTPVPTLCATALRCKRLA